MPRPAGALNKRTLLIEEMAARHALDPFEILMRFANGDWKGLGYDSETYVMENAQGATKIGYTISPEMRLIAAKEATKYLYAPRRASDPNDPIDVTPEEQELAAKQALNFIKMNYPALLKVDNE